MPFATVVLLPHALGLNRFTELPGVMQAFYESPDFGESGEQFENGGGISLYLQDFDS